MSIEGKLRKMGLFAVEGFERGVAWCGTGKPE